MAESWETVMRLFREGQKLENIMSGWRISEQRLGELIIQAYRSGETINPDWLLPFSIKEKVMEVIHSQPELTNVEISSVFKGKISPALIHALRIIVGEGRGLDSAIFNEETFFQRFHDDLHSAQKEILLVAPVVKGRHWRKHLEAFLHVLRIEGQVAFFYGKISNLIEDDVRQQKIILIEKHTNANLVVIDRRIVWEGSMNFLLKPQGEEHVRRSVSMLQAGETMDLHDLYL